MRYELPAVGSIARSYNALLDRAAERDDLEALVLVHQDAEIVDADLCAKVRAALRDPDVGARRLRRRARRPQHRLVGGVGDARLVHQPLRGARRRRPALVLVDLGGRAAVGADGRGGDARRLRARALALGRAQHPLRRVAQPLPRLRPRLLPPGPRGRPQGGHGGLPRHPPPRDRDAPRPARSGSRPTSASPRSGTAGCRGIGTAPGSWRERALRAEAERDAAGGDGAHARCSSSRRAPASSSAASPRRARACRGGSARRCGRARTPAAAMIAFGSVDRRPRGLPALRRAGHPARRRARLRGPRVRGGRHRLPRLQPAARRRRGATTTSRRSCSSTRAPRSPTPASAPRSREALRDPEVAVAGPVGARDVAHDRVVGGRGQQRAGRPPLLRARRRRDGRLRAGPARRAARRGRRGRRLPARAVAVGGADAPLRRVARARGTATTSTTACRSARPAARWSPPTCARSTTARSSCCRGPRGLGRRAHQAGRASGTAAGRAAAASRWTGSAAPAAPRPSARRRGRWPTRARSGSTRRCWRSSARWPR